MAKLKHKNKYILEEMKHITNVFELGFGLMFASKKKIERGVCLHMNPRHDVKFGCAITMYFVFHTLDVIFINSKFKVVDKITIKPWVATYVPENPATYVVETSKDRFKDVKIGDKVELIF